MLDKKRQERIRPVAELEKTVTEILVANGRAIEPFVKVFNYSDENVAKSQLGALLGMFEITEQSEDSAYIVNFLASVARKEHFNNPRRGAVESFEAALHKINLALAELVKHGNVAWLGKFHGAIGVLEKSNFHFSVTGSAKIFLLRNGNLAEISAGLASEDSSLHPIKTFVEISSGRMLPQDKIILASPELFSLLSVEGIGKNALRMDDDRFTQFLRTVLVNELDMAGALVIDFQEKPERPSSVDKPENQDRETLRNVFSQEAFVPQPKNNEALASEAEDGAQAALPAEYVDSKTGHIYIQGDMPKKQSAHQGLERVKLSLQGIFYTLGSFVVTQGKFLRRGKKQWLILLGVLTGHGNAAIRKAMRTVRRKWRKSAFAIRHALASFGSSRHSEATRAAHTSVSSGFPQKPTPTSAATQDDTDVPDFMKEKLIAFYQKNGIPEPIAPLQEPRAGRTRPDAETMLRCMRNARRTGYVWLRSLSAALSYGTRNACRRALFFWQSRSPRHRRFIAIGVIACVIALGTGMFFLVRQTAQDVPAPIAETPQPETPLFPIDTEKNARLLESPITLATQEGIIASVLLNDDIYVITAENIIGVREDKRYALPAGSGAAMLAAPMDDLRLIFISTDAGELFAWSPINRAFVKNTLALPENTAVRDIDTYLTYLYVLDGAHNQVYRFPRAEGGFGAPSFWLKDSVAFEENAQLAVNETIFVAPNKSTVQAFFRGRFVKNLEEPNTTLAITHLFTHPGLTHVYALDADNKRILVWNQDGALIAQYFSEQLAGARTIAVNETTGEIFLTTQNALLSVKIDPGQ